LGNLYSNIERFAKNLAGNHSYFTGNCLTWVHDDDPSTIEFSCSVGVIYSGPPLNRQRIGPPALPPVSDSPDQALSLFHLSRLLSSLTLSVDQLLSALLVSHGFWVRRERENQKNRKERREKEENKIRKEGRNEKCSCLLKRDGPDI
jgi:hypothetical protein